MEKEGLMPACIDGKNIMSDFLFDALFDNCSYIENKGVVVGFIANSPVILRYRHGSNSITLDSYGNNIDGIVNRFKAIDDDGDDDIVSDITVFQGQISVDYYFKEG